MGFLRSSEKADLYVFGRFFPLKCGPRREKVFGEAGKERGARGGGQKDQLVLRPCHADIEDRRSSSVLQSPR